MDLLDKYFDNKVIYLQSLLQNEDRISLCFCYPEPFTKLGELIYYNTNEFSNILSFEEGEENVLESVIDFIDEDQKIFLITDSREIRFSYKKYEFNRH